MPSSAWLTDAQSKTQMASRFTACSLRFERDGVCGPHGVHHIDKEMREQRRSDAGSGVPGVSVDGQSSEFLSLESSCKSPGSDSPARDRRWRRRARAFRPGSAVLPCPRGWRAPPRGSMVANPSRLDSASPARDKIEAWYSVEFALTCHATGRPCGSRKTRTGPSASRAWGRARAFASRRLCGSRLFDRFPAGPPPRNGVRIFALTSV